MDTGPTGTTGSRVERGLTLRGEIRKLASLALPVALTQVGYMLFGVVDLMMVGRVGTAEIAACQLGNTWVAGTLLLGVGLVYGMGPIVSQAHGSGDSARVGRTLHRGILLALMASVPVSLLFLVTEEVLVLTGQDPQLAALAERYAVVQIPSVPCFLVFTALREYLQGREIVKPALVIVLVANALNAFANWAFVFGNAGAPELGLVGSGIATSLTRGSMVVALWAWIVVAGLQRDAWVPWTRASFRLGGLSECLSHGVPVAIQMGLEVWAFQIATLIAGWLGTTQLAAHGIVLNMASTSFMIPLGISFGATTRVGNLIGAGDHQGAQRAAWVALAMGAAAMAIPAVLFLVFREELPRVYTPEAPVLAAAAAILPIAAAFQVFDGTQVVGCGVLRGMGRTRPAVVFNLIGYYALALPLAWWLALERGTGLPGVWWGLSLGLACVAFLLVYWIRAFGPAHEARVGATRLQRDTPGTGV
jgi:MATE family multidrug resistance protein